MAVLPDVLIGYYTFYYLCWLSDVYDIVLYGLLGISFFCVVSTASIYFNFWVDWWFFRIRLLFNVGTLGYVYILAGLLFSIGIVFCSIFWSSYNNVRDVSFSTIGSKRDPNKLDGSTSSVFILLLGLISPSRILTYW